MAVGDIICSLSAHAALLNFQPAAGVEVLITGIGGNGNSVVASLYDGANVADFTTSNVYSNTGFNNMNIKLGITNTNYIQVAAGSNKTFFTGIQTK